VRWLSIGTEHDEMDIEMRLMKDNYQRMTKTMNSDSSLAVELPDIVKSPFSAESDFPCLPFILEHSRVSDLIFLSVLNLSLRSFIFG
jgi:hypothetical protein